MTAPFRPPQINAKWPDIDVWNALVSHSGKTVPLPHVKGASLAFAVAKPPADNADTLELRTANGAEFLCVVQSFPFKKLFGADFGIAELPDLPPPLQQVLREGVVASLVPAIPGNILGPVEIKSSGPYGRFAPALTGPLHWLALTITGICPEPVAVLAGGQVSQIAALFQPAPASLRNWPALKLGLMVPAWFSLGEMTLGLAQLQALQPGDFLVLAADTLSHCWLRTRACLYSIQINAAALTCTGVSRRLQPHSQSPALRETHKMDDAHGSGAPAPIDPSSLPLQVDFDIGQIEVPLAEIETWQAGTVIKLAPPALADGVEVTLRCNNQIIATGDLVRIDDRLAVRVTRLVMVAQG